MSGKALIAPISTGALAWRTVAVGIGSQQHRTFSTTQIQARAESIHFKEASTKELQTVLDKVFKYIILPSYLKPKQRGLLFSEKEKHIQLLTNEPITIELEGETFRFESLSRRDTPSADTSIKSALNAFASPTDWQNLEPLLVGLWQAGRSLHSDTKSKIIRRLAQNGHIGDTISWMRNPTRTGFFLNSHEPVSTFLLLTYREAMVDYRGDVNKSLRCLRRCRVLFEDILQRSEHGGSPLATRLHKRYKDMRFPLTVDPQLLSVPLGLRANLYLSNHQRDKEEHGKSVLRLSRLISNLWKPKTPVPEPQKGGGVIGGQGLAGLHPKDSYNDRAWVKYLSNANKRYEWASVIVRSFEDAAEVLCRMEHEHLAKQMGKLAEVVRREAEVDRESPIVNKDLPRNKPFVLVEAGEDGVAILKKAQEEALAAGAVPPPPPQPSEESIEQAIAPEIGEPDTAEGDATTFEETPTAPVYPTSFQVNRARKSEHAVTLGVFMWQRLVGKKRKSTPVYEHEGVWGVEKGKKIRLQTWEEYEKILKVEVPEMVGKVYCEV